MPAGFRSALSEQPFQGVVLIRARNCPALEGFGWNMMEELVSRLDQFDIFSDEQDDLATAIFGEAVQLPFDGDGRIVLPPALAEYANIEEQAAFVGMGRKFQIWAPDALAGRREAAREKVRAQGLTLPKGGA